MLHPALDRPLVGDFQGTKVKHNEKKRTAAVHGHMFIVTVTYAPQLTCSGADYVLFRDLKTKFDQFLVKKNPISNQIKMMVLLTSKIHKKIDRAVANWYQTPKEACI